MNLILANNARPILHAWNAKGMGIVLAEWHNEYVTWRMEVHPETHVVHCEHGHYFRKVDPDGFKNALKNFRERVAEFFAD